MTAWPASGMRMTARIIDGKAIAAELRGKVAAEVQRLDRAAWPHAGPRGGAGRQQSGERSLCPQQGQGDGRGRHALVRPPPAGRRVGEAELLALIAELNADPAVHGILVQLPLPPQIDAQQVLAAIDPGKDVDGFHPVNAGRLATGLPALVPCTPLGCVHAGQDRASRRSTGLDAVVIGRSNIVGKPLAQLLLAENATVTIAHSRTRDLPAVCRRADLLFAAIGRPEMVRGDWIKPGATVIDVGINRVPARRRQDRASSATSPSPRPSEVAGAITPVPGGVGPMTIACLLVNTVRAACALAGLPAPKL